jgi:DNA primase
MRYFNTTEIRESHDLLQMCTRLTPLRRVASTNGGEWAGPCPVCGGTDRFRVQPDRNRWACRQCCPQWSDVIELVCWSQNVGFLEACRRLDGTVTDTVAPPKPPAQSFLSAPCHQWQARAEAFTRYAADQLWNTPEALAYLRNRGFSDATIEKAQLGYNPTDVYDSPRRWGVVCADKVWLSKGWTIPRPGWYIKIRRTGEPKYVTVKGSRTGGVLYRAAVSGHDDVVIVEGELSALSLAQVAGHLCDVVSLGSAVGKPSEQATGELMAYQRRWSLYDNDEAGSMGASSLPQTTPLDWPWGEMDANDALVAGHPIAEWLERQIGPMSFEAWLIDQDHRTDGIGDLARAMEADEECDPAALRRAHEEYAREVGDCERG